MIITTGNSIPASSSVPAMYPKTSAASVGTESAKKDVDRNFDQVMISSRDSSKDSKMMDIKSKIYNDLQTVTTTGTISSIRNQISSGEYEIDPDAIAKKLLLI